VKPVSRIRSYFIFLIPACLSFLILTNNNRHYFLNLLAPGPFFMVCCFLLLVSKGIKPVSQGLIIFTIAGCFIYWAMFLLTLFTGILAAFTVLFFAGAGAIALGYLSDQYLWPGKNKGIFFFISGSAGMIACPLTLLKPVRMWLHEAIPALARIDPADYFIPGVFLWQVLVGGYWFNGLMQAKVEDEDDISDLDI
jgi:hypothetical protein